MILLLVRAMQVGRRAVLVRGRQAADAAAQQLLDDEAASSWGKGMAKEWVRLTRRLLSLPRHGQ